MKRPFPTAAAVVALAASVMTPETVHAQAINQVTDASAGQACVDDGGALSGSNLFSAADNGTFGTGSGAANEFLPSNIYAPAVTGTRYNSSYSGYQHGDFSYVSNQTVRRNGGQFLGTQIDPVYGASGFFMVSDPDSAAPVFSQTINSLVPGLSYEVSFWVADTEFGTGAKNRVAVDVDGSQEFITPFINSNGAGDETNPVVWQKHSYVYTHSATTTSVDLSVRINETGSSGRDIFLDNIEVRLCELPADLTTVKSLTAGGDATPAVGDTVSFDIAITNNGSGLATGVSLTDLLPAGLTIAAGHGTITGDTNSPGGTYDPSTGVWDIGSVSLNETVTLMLVGTVDAGQEGQSITNTVVAASGNEPDPGTAGDDLTETVVVSTIAANDDDFTATPIDSTAGGSTATVLTDDLLNGSSVATDGSATTISITDLDGLTGATIADNGVITVPPGTTPGTYNITYQLCDEANATVCDTAIATVVVTDIAANDDDFSGAPIDPSTGGTTASVLTDDILNGSSVATDGSETTVSITDNDGLTGATIADSGEITVPPNTARGVYNITYQLCDEANPLDCDTAIATIVVGTIVAEDDDFSGSPIDNVTGGSTPSVLSDDLLNGSAVATNGAQTTLLITNNGGLTGATIADDGVITVPAGTNPGTYNITYELCDQSNPTDCDTAIATVVVSGTLIPAIEDELKAVLQDDLAVTIARQSAQASDYAKGALERLRSHNRSGAECAAAATLQARFILFDTDKAILKPQSERALDEIAAILGSCAGSAFEIGGHTDSDASDAYNVDLSQRRVNAVLFALQQRDIDTRNFIAKGYGEAQPVASNATAAGKAQNRRVAFTFLGDVEHTADFRACHDGAAPTRNFNLTANNQGVSVDGDLHRETYSCATNRWSIIEGTLGFTKTDSGISQGSLNLSYRRERLIDTDSIRGFFVGAYGSQSDVTEVATGSINGFGVNAGLYGAERLRANLFLDAHIGFATGIHDFDLAFDDGLGVINTAGDYRYIAGFFGAALSGEMTYEEYTFAPRVGFNYAYSPGGDVDVTAAMAGLSETGSLDLDTVSGGSVFAEVRIARAFNENRSEFALTPRVACFQSLESFDGDCSFGASLGFATLEATDEFRYSVELSGERASSFSRASLTASVSKALGLGEISANAGIDSEGVQRLGGAFELQF